MTARAMRRHHRDRIKANMMRLLARLGRKMPAPITRRELGKLKPYQGPCDCWWCTAPNIKIEKLRRKAEKLDERHHWFT